MTSTVQQVIDETLNHLHTSTREEVNTLNGALTNSQTNVVTTYDLGGIAVGSEIEVDLEVMRVMATDTSTKTATVLRAQRGTTAATHSTGAVVTVNPKFPKARIVQAINEELVALSAEGLYRMQTVDLMFSAAQAGYNLTSVTDLIDVYDVRYDPPGPENNWPRAKWRLARDQSSSDFASGLALIVQEGGWPGRTIRVQYKSGFSATLAAVSDVVETVSGLPATAVDILSLGAAARLAAPREVARNTHETQGQPRRSSEVPPGANLNAARALMGQRQIRVSQERRRLAQKYPPLGRD